jgi:hypothetical protein
MTTAELALDRSAVDRSSLPIAIEAVARTALLALDFGARVNRGLDAGDAHPGGGTDGR